MMLALLFAVSTLLGVAFFVFKDKQIVEESQEASNPTPVATEHDLAMLGLSQQLERDIYPPASIPSFDNSTTNYEIKWELGVEKEKPKKSRKKSKKKTKKKPAKKSKKRK